MAATLENWRKLDWEVLGGPQLEGIRTKLLQERLKLQKKHGKMSNNPAAQRRLKIKLGSNRRKLEGVTKRINSSKKGKHKRINAVQARALALALKQGEFSPEVEELLRRAKKIGVTKIDSWMDDFVSYSKKNHPKEGPTQNNDLVS